MGADPVSGPKQQTAASPARADRDALIAARNNAATANEILEAEARIAYANANDGAACPGEMIPTEADARAWGKDAAAVEAAHREWLELPDPSPAHPLAPFVAAWQVLRQHDRTPEAVILAAMKQAGENSRQSPDPIIRLAAPPADAPMPDMTDRDARIVLERLADHPDGRSLIERIIERMPPREATPFQPKPRGSLARLARMTEDDARLPNYPGRHSPAMDQLTLPGMGPEITHCPSWLLWMFDRAGGESLSAGRGAPWDLRLFIGALLHLAVAERDGEWRTLRFPHLREHEADWPIPGTPSIEAWLHPNGWSNRRRDWEKLPAALRKMQELLGFIPVAGGSVQIVFPSTIPDRPDFPVVEFSVRLPRSAADGARIDWERLRQYGTDSAALYRAYLAVSAHLDRSAHHGHAITRQIGAPVLNAAGKPMRRKDGGFVRSATEQIDNRHARYVPTLTDADLARMIGLDGDSRVYRQRARKALSQLEADGVVELARERGGLRIFGTPNSRD